MLAAATAMTAVHATEPASVHLGLRARVAGLSVADVEAALYEQRSLVKQLAMRRTLFAFPRDLLPAAWGSASARVAATEAARLARDLERSGVAADGPAWLRQAAAAVVDHLSGGAELDAAGVRAAVPQAGGRIRQGSGRWSAEAHLTPRLLTVLGARADLVRGHNAGHWRISRPQWTATTAWLGAEPAPLGEAAGYAELVRRWLWAFGPGTEADLSWWLGSTKTAARAALAAVSATPVELESGQIGWVLPGDAESVPDPGDWAALLPALDSTVMGWKQRDFYLDPADVPYLFDANGNAGTTAWWNGRVVGCWVQDAAGSVRVIPRAPLPSAAVTALDSAAAELTDWLDGVVVNSIYASPQMRGERLF